MNREKQIEEMQNALIKIAEQPIMIEGLVHWSDAIAEELYKAGYRKADEVEVRHGEWKLHPDGSGTCSCCNRTQKSVWDYDNAQNFCGHCGAKMDGEKQAGACKNCVHRDEHHLVDEECVEHSIDPTERIFEPPTEVSRQC